MEENRTSSNVDELVRKAEEVQQTETKKGSGIPRLIISLILIALQIMSMAGTMKHGGSLPGLGLVGVGYYGIGILGLILFFSALVRISRNH